MAFRSVATILGTGSLDEEWVNRVVEVTSTMEFELSDQGVRHLAGVWDGLSARLATRAGYDGLFISGAAVSASLGLPDAELTTRDDTLRALWAVTRSTHLPVLVDMDTGYGDAVTFRHSVQEMVRAGAAAVMLEDQVSPKPGAIVSGAPPALASIEDVCAKVAAARDVAGNRVVLVVRSDAGPADLIERLTAYGAAGADVLFPLVFDDSLPVEQWRRLADLTGKPLACTLAPNTWIEATMTDDVARSAGVRLVVHSLHALLASVTAIEKTYRRLRAGEPAAQVSADAVGYSHVSTIVESARVKELRSKLTRPA